MGIYKFFATCAKKLDNYEISDSPVLVSVLFKFGLNRP